ncbi:uncharacterized protein BT62DRAFT_226555 [Guyanagaster necrorhizus]|uniref:Uncharacterized protein n=1 Tax=Guyanagaster necrorhizus TaxID=856835 RepID=A0A9P7VQF3_9AGAR|nr:uncharacterized protein BT62DRAFT_226555 [Guyanagaster necrorhizus MCA 3950]KAG7444773.1 hypothetical protein BT62DRAFT_226555 [Guyanagaster necrorhizus MCA 3950]
MTCCDCCPTDPFVWPLSVVQPSFRHCLCKIGHTFSACSIRLYEDNQCTLPPMRTHTYTSSISSSHHLFRFVLYAHFVLPWSISTYSPFAVKNRFLSPLDVLFSQASLLPQVDPLQADFARLLNNDHFKMLGCSCACCVSLLSSPAHQIIVGAHGDVARNSVLPHSCSFRAQRPLFVFAYRLGVAYFQSTFLGKAEVAAIMAFPSLVLDDGGVGKDVVGAV